MILSAISLRAQLTVLTVFMVWPHRQGGIKVGQWGHFVDMRGKFFAIFLWTSFMDGPKYLSDLFNLNTCFSL